MQTNQVRNSCCSLGGIHLTPTVERSPRFAEKTESRPYVVAYRESLIDDDIWLRSVEAPSCLDDAFVLRCLAFDQGVVDIRAMDLGF